MNGGEPKEYVQIAEKLIFKALAITKSKYCGVKIMQRPEA